MSLFPSTALWCRHAKTVRDSTFNYKIDYDIIIKNILNPEGHQNPFSGSTVTAILLKGFIWPIGGKSLRLQPAQQACLSDLITILFCRRALVTLGLLAILNYTELYLSFLYLPLFSEVHCNKIAALITGLLLCAYP